MRLTGKMGGGSAVEVQWAWNNHERGWWSAASRLGCEGLSSSRKGAREEEEEEEKGLRGRAWDSMDS
jgi:hypothetical protein